ncbi:DUF6252 family protein [Flavobacterium sp.]|uniref:DUF6252 family protein n=1 Tax=Flavobacterium sp. TaxID=239 RepID=UPI0037AB475E
MKKLFLYITLLFALTSCQDNVTFNSPSFQGQKDNIFWRAVDSKATIVSGSLTIEGLTRNEKVSLKTSSPIKGTYFLGTSTSNTATYIMTDATSTITFTTGFGVGEGQIVISEYDAVNKTVTGTFKFNAVNSILPSSILNFQYGHFYKVPVK